MEKEFHRQPYFLVPRILSHGEQQIVSWFQPIWKNMDMRKRSICIREQQMCIH